VLAKFDDISKYTYGFDFKDPSKLDGVATIKSIGVEHRTNMSYFWDCNIRGEADIFIFQYTLSGCGEIKIQNKTHPLPEGHAFIISVPENCQYYIPASSSDWEFIFITLAGDEVRKCWEYINSTHGYVFEISNKRKIIQQLFSIYYDIQSGQVLDIYQFSQRAYEFLSLSYRHFETRVDSMLLKIPPDIINTLQYIKENFTTDLSIDDISEQTEISKSHLSRKFKKFIGYSPLNYLNKYRIEQASYLLNHTSKTVKEISVEVGFADPNYFCKAFRKITGTSPNSFRKAIDTQYHLSFLITDDHGMIKLDKHDE